MTKLRAEATGWFARVQNTPETHPDRVRLRVWLAADPAHAEAYAEIQRLWDRLDSVAEVDALAATVARRRRRRLVGQGAAAIIVGGGGR